MSPKWVVSDERSWIGLGMGWVGCGWLDGVDVGG